MTKPFPPSDDGPTTLDAQPADGAVEPSRMPEPLSDIEVEVRSLKHAVIRARRQGRLLMVLGFLSGLACGALLMVIYGGL